MAVIPMEYGGGDIHRTTETINTGAGTIVFPNGRRVINAVYNDYNILLINTNVAGHDYAAYFLRGTGTVTQVPANTDLSVTYTYIETTE
jgi:hypothetical protein